MSSKKKEHATLTMEQIAVEIAAADAELEALAQLEDDVLDDVNCDEIHDEDLPQLDKTMANVVVIDNLPKVGAEKLKKLTSVLHKKCITSFSSSGFENKLTMPMNQATGKTLGFCFVEFESAQRARKFKANINGFQFDKKHNFRVNMYDELQTFLDTSSDYVAPENPTFDRRDDLYWWLKDGDSRDQFVIRQAKNTEVSWIEGPQITPPDLCYDGPPTEKAQGKTWCEMEVQWSPEGLYLATLHPQGLILWGGPDWRKVQRFACPRVWRCQFSPDESYMITWDGIEDPRSKSMIVWDIKSGRKLRDFAYQPKEHGAWPCFQWSHDGTMFARKGPGVITVYSTPECKILNKKSLRAPGVQDFFWSPCGYDMKVGGCSKTGGTPVIGYWSPEIDNKPAVVRLICMPNRKELVSKNMYEVKHEVDAITGAVTSAGMKIFWQNAGEYLCVQVTRHSKTKKTHYTNFEIFRMKEAHQSVAVEHLEQKQQVSAFTFEPNSYRFAYVYGDSAARGNVDFYTMGSGRNGDKKMQKLYTLENKQCNSLYFSPMGNYLVLAGTGNINGQLEFWDTDSQMSMMTQEHFMCNQISWDPSGRVVCTAVTRPMYGGGESLRYQLENGYKLWTFQGAPMYEIQKPEFYQFLWRPRPALLLSPEKQEYIKRNLKQYASKFDAREKQIKLKRKRKQYNEMMAKYIAWMKASEIRDKSGKMFTNKRSQMGIVLEIASDYEMIEETIEIELDAKEEKLA